MDGVETSREPVARTGEILKGRYRLRSLIGRGGVGSVFRAIDLRLEREVAVKVIHLGHTAIPSAAQRVAREARSMAALDSPHVVPLYDVDCTADRWFLVQKLLEGLTLAEHIHAGVSAAAAIEWTCQVLIGLEAVHDAGLVHRDVKPANVMIDRGETAVLLDLGLVHHLDGERLTDRSVVLGTPAFMGPEQAIGELATPRTDLYATALMLLVAVTSAGPGRVVIPDVSDRVSGDAWLTDRLRGVPRELRKVLRRALARDPARRYGDAGELRDALRAVPVSAVVGYRSAVQGKTGRITALAAGSSEPDQPVTTNIRRKR